MTPNAWLDAVRGGLRRFCPASARFALLATGFAVLAAPLARAQTNVGRYEKFEVTYSYTNNYSNVYDPAIVDVHAVFTAPSGAQKTVPGFFYQSFTRSGDVTAETLTLVANSGKWKVRFAPTELGTYSYTVTKTDVNGTITLGSGTFTCVTSSNPGFIKAVGYHLEFTNGQPFYPLGVNAPWFQYKTNGHEGSWGEGTYGFDAMLTQYLANGANAFHLWTCNWGFGAANPFASPNCACDGTSDDTLTQMRQPDSWTVDYIVDQCHANNIFVMPILKHRDGQAFTAGDQIYQRYAVARWGYSTNIMAWDTFKENGTNASVVDAYCSALKSIDPYGHPVTVSQWNHYDESNTNNFNTVFNLASVDIVQVHDYSNECQLPYQNDTGLFAMDWMLTPPSDLRRFGKPGFFGETGVHPCDTDGVHDVFGVRSSFYDVDSGSRIMRGSVWGEFLATMGAFSAWYYNCNANGGGSWTNISAFKGLSAYIASIPAGKLTDSAILISSYTDSTKVSTSDSRLQAIGRKTATFALLRVMNTTGTWANIVRDGLSPTPLTGTVTLKGMQASGSFQTKWYNPITGALISTVNNTSTTGGNLTVTLPQALSEDVAAIVTSSTAVINDYRVNCGGAAASPYAVDNFFSGGSTGSVTATIDTSGVSDPAPQAVYQTRRFATAPATFTYTLPGLSASTTYTVRLHFSEHAKSSAGGRQFHVDINGTRVLTNFDIFAAAGAKNKAVVREFTTTANGSGQIVILFSPGAIDNPLINGIQIQH